MPAYDASFSEYDDLKDYYGFLKSGIVQSFDNDFSVSNLDAICSNASPVPPEKIRRYSATHGTSYEGNEEKLVALTLRDLMAPCGFDVYQSINDEIFSVFLYAKDL